MQILNRTLLTCGTSIEGRADAAISFAELAARLKYEDIPQATVDVAKKDILDTLGAILAGSTAEGAEAMAGLAEELGGKPESSVIAYGLRVPSPEAAMLNAYMAHSIDYDDTYDVAVIHCGPLVIPAAFAAAERKGNVSGKEFIAAVVLGIEMMCRIALAKEGDMWGGGWSGTRLYGYYAAALAAARILGLSGEQTLSALGLAHSQSAGNLQGVIDGTSARNFDVGCASRGGLYSALSAQRGISGGCNALEGDFGLFKIFHQGKYNREALTGELGKRFEMTNLSFKPYPCARPIHPFVDLALALRREHNIRPEDVREVIGHVSQEPHLQFHPIEKKQNPQTANEAKLSIPYCVAVALDKGAVVIDDFTESAVADLGVGALARKIYPKLDPSLARSKEIPPAVIEIRTPGGTYSKRCEYPLGHPENPLSIDSLLLKFRDCADHGKRRLPEETVSKVVDLVAKIEELDNVVDVISLIR